LEIVILKVGALGDVLRTTAILPGLAARYLGARITWVTARDALDLVRHHGLVARALGVDPRSQADLERVPRECAAAPVARILSLDDEQELCRLATRLALQAADGNWPDALARLSGAYLASDGSRRYTPDVAPWFDMGLLSIFGKAEADRLKQVNVESHPALFARMLGLAEGEPALPLAPHHVARAASFAERTRLGARGLVIGLNTGAAGRWESKRLPVDRTAELTVELTRALDGRATFLLLGGPEEAERNAAILRVVGGRAPLVDAGTANELLDFAALVARLDLLITSDSLALHVAVSQRVPVLAFFAPTSAAEIELHGRGEKVASTASDACSYRPDADTSSLTVERLRDAALRVLASRGARS
jgi:heptosyltransferase-2